jgi:hypothetical protein
MLAQLPTTSYKQHTHSNQPTTIIMAPSLHTLHVVLLLTTLILLLLTTQRVFAHTTKLRVSRRNINGHKCQSHQEDHKSLSSQHDHEGHKCHSQQSTAQHVSTYLHAIIIASLDQCVSAITRLRAAQHDLPHSQRHFLKSTTLHVMSILRVFSSIAVFAYRIFGFAKLRPAPKNQDYLLPHSAQRDLKSMALRPLPHLQVIIYFLMASINNLLALFITYLSNKNVHQPHTKLDLRMTTPHYDGQSTTSSTVVFAMRPLMHWICHPASYSMMQHQSRTALYHESAQANTYVSTPIFTYPHHEQQLTSSQGLPRLA